MEAQLPDTPFAAESRFRLVKVSKRQRKQNTVAIGDDNTIRFLSVEPQHEELDLGQWLPRLDWLIQGGESGCTPHPFDLKWAIDMIGQCKDAGVAYFLKQLGSAVVSKGQQLSFNNSHAGDWSEWPEEVRVREMPRRIMVKVDGANPQPALAETRTPLVVIESQIIETRAPNVKEAGKKKWTRSKTVRKTLGDRDGVVAASAV